MACCLGNRAAAVMRSPSWPNSRNRPPGQQTRNQVNHYLLLQDTVQYSTIRPVLPSRRHVAGTSDAQFNRDQPRHSLLSHRVRLAMRICIAAHPMIFTRIF